MDGPRVLALRLFTPPCDLTGIRFMSNPSPRFFRTALAGAAVCTLAFALAGCTRHISKDITPDGHAGEVIFPASDRALLKQGTFPKLEQLRSVGPGMTKAQLYELLGAPHFHEGFRAREWDYLFHFRSADDSVRTCQYKVIFDQHYLAQTLAWSPQDCAEVLKIEAEESTPAVEHHALPSDALFGFAGHGVDDMLPDGRQALTALAEQIRSSGAKQVVVTGYTDRIGQPQDNLRLSRQRAETVRTLLTQEGVPADIIRIEGRGDADPVKQCATQARQALINCLAPNRRVEVDIQAK